MDQNSRGRISAVGCVESLGASSRSTACILLAFEVAEIAREVVQIVGHLEDHEKNIRFLLYVLSFNCCLDARGAGGLIFSFVTVRRN